MRLGRISAPTDVPARAETLRAMLASRGVTVDSPPDYGREPLEGIHSHEYLDYLEHAYTRWQAMRANGADPGPEVLPNLSPYYNGRVEHAARGPCPPPPSWPKPATT